MELVVRDVAPADAEAVVAIFNPIIEARVHTAFDTPFTVDAERDYILNFPQRGVALAVSELSDPQPAATCSDRSGRGR